MRAFCPFLILVVLSIVVLSRVTEAQKAEEDAEKSGSLELPDVIIYGVETGFREAGEKMSISESSPPTVLLNDVDLYPPFPFTAHEQALPTVQGSIQYRNTVFSSYVGSYSSWGLQAVHNQTIKRSNLRLIANLAGTDGEYDNSGGTWSEIEGRVNTSLTPSLTGGLQVGYRRWSYGLYGTTVPLGKSRQEIYTIKSHMDYLHSENTLSRINLAFQRLILSPSYYYDRFENLYQGDLSLQTKLGPIRITSNVRWMGDRPSMDDTGMRPHDANFVIQDFPSSDLLSLSCGARIPFLPQFSADLGGDAQFYSRGGHDDRNRFFPKARFLFRPAAPVAIHTSLGGGFVYYSQAKLHEENPYADPLVSSTVEEIRWQVEAGMEVEVRFDLLLRGSYRYAQRRGDLYWRWVDVVGLYKTFHLEDVRQHQIDISGSYQPYKNLKVEAGFSFLDYSIKDRFIAVGNSSPEIPFRPKNQAWGIVTYSIPGIVDVRSDWKWIGKRKAFLPLPYDSFYDTLELDPYLLINITLEKEVHRAITLFAKLYNLTDSEYEVWYHYPEMGFNIHGGVKVVF